LKVESYELGVASEELKVKSYGLRLTANGIWVTAQPFCLEGFCCRAGFAILRKKVLGICNPRKTKVRNRNSYSFCVI